MSAQLQVYRAARRKRAADAPDVEVVENHEALPVPSGDSESRHARRCLSPSDSQLARVH
jgi:hypothetical protein